MLALSEYRSLWFRPQRVVIGNKAISLLGLLGRDYPELKEMLNQNPGIQRAGIEI
jgi:hypothetical protein